MSWGSSIVQKKQDGFALWQGDPGNDPGDYIDCRSRGLPDRFQDHPKKVILELQVL